MPRTNQSFTTNTHAGNALGMIKMARDTQEPTWAAQLIADAIAELTWSLRSAVQECSDAGIPWAAIGELVNLPRETVFRQYRSGGPIVPVRATQAAPKPQAVKATTPGTEAVFAFQAENDDTWFGSPDAVPPGEYVSGMLPFQPADPSNRFGGQMLRVRVGRVREDVTASSAQVKFADQDRRFPVTLAVVSLLLEDGQTPLRRALTDLVHATIGNPAVGSEFEQVVLAAARAQGQSVSAAGESRIPTEEFLAAVHAVLAEARRVPDQLDAHAEIALRQLERVVDEYEAWSRAAR